MLCLRSYLQECMEQKTSKNGIMSVCLKGRKLCFISTVKKWITDKDSDSQEIPNPAVSSNTNPTCNDAPISLKPEGAGATISYAQTSVKKVITSSD